MERAFLKQRKANFPMPRKAKAFRGEASGRNKKSTRPRKSEDFQGPEKQSFSRRKTIHQPSKKSLNKY